MGSIFSRIVAGEITCHKVAEDDRFLAFMDIMPLAVGHTLVIPKEEVDRIWIWSQKRWVHCTNLPSASRWPSRMPSHAKGSAWQSSGSVPHAHVHLIPLQSVQDINFERPKLSLSQEALAETAATLQEAYQRLA